MFLVEQITRVMFFDFCFLFKLPLPALYTVPQEQVLCSRYRTDRSLPKQLSPERIGGYSYLPGPSFGLILGLTVFTFELRGRELQRISYRSPTIMAFRPIAEASYFLIDSSLAVSGGSTGEIYFLS